VLGYESTHATTGLLIAFVAFLPIVWLGLPSCLKLPVDFDLPSDGAVFGDYRPQVSDLLHKSL
jgi:hypothetical protein